MRKLAADLVMEKLLDKVEEKVLYDEAQGPITEMLSVFYLVRRSRSICFKLCS